jgi:Domain of unknown function (DUF4845)
LRGELTIEVPNRTKLRVCNKPANIEGATVHNTFKHQKGLTLISTVLLLGLIGFFVMLILRIGPIYLEHRKVKAVLEEVKDLRDLDNKSEYEVRETLNKRLDMNYIERLKADNIKIAKRGGYMKVEVVYDVVEKIAGNLSVLVEFNDVVEVGHE